MAIRDHNLCADCGSASPLRKRTCASCGSPLHPAKGDLVLWLLEGTSVTLASRLAERVAHRLGREARIAPGRIAAAPSRRARPWKGHSANAFLNQVVRRTRRAELALGITDENIVPAASWNFLFGLGCMNGRCAVMSLHPLRADGASTAQVLRRAEAIAVHELGHGLGLDHHPYGDVACVMVGDVEQDCVDELDAGVATFCAACKRHFSRAGRTRNIRQAPARG